MDLTPHFHLSKISPIQPLYPITSPPTGRTNWPKDEFRVSNLNWQQFFPCHNKTYSILYYYPLLYYTFFYNKDELEACREAKHRLEMDWSDKYSAQHLGKVDKSSAPLELSLYNKYHHFFLYETTWIVIYILHLPNMQRVRGPDSRL